MHAKSAWWLSECAQRESPAYVEAREGDGMNGETAGCGERSESHQSRGPMREGCGAPSAYRILRALRHSSESWQCYSTAEWRVIHLDFLTREATSRWAPAFAGVTSFSEFLQCLGLGLGLDKADPQKALCRNQMLLVFVVNHKALPSSSALMKTARL